jgi:transposase
LLTPASGNDSKLTEWIVRARGTDLPHLHSFCNGLELDRAAVNAGLTLPWSNGRTEGVNTRTKKIMRQMHARAGFDLLRHHRLRNRAERLTIPPCAGGGSRRCDQTDGALRK